MRMAATVFIDWISLREIGPVLKVSAWGGGTSGLNLRMLQAKDPKMGSLLLALYDDLHRSNIEIKNNSLTPL